MSFRKRNAILSPSVTRPGEKVALTAPEKRQILGVRPSPLDGRLTTSTGTSSLDSLLAGHVGLPLGTCLLVEEQGTTDFSGVLLRYYAAEGLVQGHQVHTLAFPTTWKNELPGILEPAAKTKSAQPSKSAHDELKIAWRYKALGNATGGRHATETGSSSPFCHSFDLTKRLAVGSCAGSLHAVPTLGPALLSQGPTKSVSHFKTMINHLRATLAASGPSVIHRVIVPSLLSPSLYAPGSSDPAEVLQFLHCLRSLLRQYSTQLTAMITLPEPLFPRSSGLTRWIELLCDGVIELVPSQAYPIVESPSTTEKKDATEAIQLQGFLRVHSLPVYHEKGGGSTETTHLRENLTFSLSASKGLVIKPFSLPPLGEENSKEKSSGAAQDGMDF